MHDFFGVNLILSEEISFEMFSPIWEIYLPIFSPYVLTKMKKNVKNVSR